MFSLEVLLSIVQRCRCDEQIGLEQGIAGTGEKNIIYYATGLDSVAIYVYNRATEQEKIPRCEDAKRFPYVDSTDDARQLWHGQM
jgi:hypothetical protein